MCQVPKLFRASRWSVVCLVMVVALTPVQLGQAQDEKPDMFSGLSYERLMSRADQILRERDFAGRLALQRLQERETDGEKAMKCLKTFCVLRYRLGMAYHRKGTFPKSLGTRTYESSTRALMLKTIGEMRTAGLSRVWSKYVADVRMPEPMTDYHRQVLNLPPLRSYARDLARATALDAPPAVRVLCQELLDAPAVPPDLFKP